MMSLRAAAASIILTPLAALSSFAPDSPDRVRWLGLFWLVVYATTMIAQGAWAGWRWLFRRHTLRRV
jgi:hypothetical protein